MIRGSLRILTLKALEKQQLSGYSLMKYIEERLGTKPSPGSIYPLLDDLTKEKLVTCKEDGRQKIYSLTKEGHEQLKITQMHKDIMLKKVEESINMWAAMTGTEISAFRETIEALKKGKYSIEEIPPEVTALKIEMGRIFNKELFAENRKKVKEILKKAAEELRKIR